MLLLKAITRQQTLFKMKNLFYFSLLFCFTNCSSPAAEKINEVVATSIEESATSLLDKKMVVSISDTIPLDTFHKWVDNWKEHGRMWMDTFMLADSNQLTAFTMPLIDLSETLNESGVKQSRFYLGLEEEGSGYVAKLVVLGVDSLNYDMTDYANGQYVYDVSQSCPPYCKKEKK